MFKFNADEIFRTAINIEENGQIFYEQACKLIKNNRLKDIFAHLAKQEIIHKEIFIDLRSGLPVSAAEYVTWDPDNETDEYLKMLADMNVFRSDTDVKKILEKIHDVKGALRLSIQFEKDSVLFYLLMKALTEKDEGVKFIDRIIDEEKEHLGTLAGELRGYLKC